MRRDLFDVYHASSDFPAWPCPREVCARGILHPVGEARKKVAVESDHQIEIEGYRAAIEFGKYSAELQCSICKESVFVVGEWGNEEWQVDNEWQDVKCMYPKFFTPTIPIISIPDRCSRGVRSALREAFSSYWSSPAGAANSARIAIEKLLDDLNVPRKVQQKRITLEERIKRYAEQDKRTDGFLHATRLVGNVGSHEGDGNHKLMLDIFEMIEATLNILYPPDPPDYAELHARAAAIIGAKGRV